MGLTQSDVFKILYGIKTRVNVISDIENHMKQINPNLIDKYCKYFNCSIVFNEETI